MIANPIKTILIHPHYHQQLSAHTQHSRYSNKNWAATEARMAAPHTAQCHLHSPNRYCYPNQAPRLKPYLRRNTMTKTWSHTAASSQAAKYHQNALEIPMESHLYAQIPLQLFQAWPSLWSHVSLFLITVARILHKVHFKSKPLHSKQPASPSIPRLTFSHC